MAAGQPQRSTGRSIRVAGGITLLNVLVYGLGLVTGPLQARALGPTGRGELAAIVVVPAVLAVLADLGLSTYTLRAVARGRPVREIVGSVMPVSLGLGLIVAILGIFIATFVAAGRKEVFLFVLLGCFLMPITLSSLILNGTNWAQERWSIWTLVRTIPSVGGFLATVLLFVLGRLTVTTAAAAVLTLGVLGILPLLTVLRGTGRPYWDVGVAREAVSFGARSWLFGVSALANARLDQLMMTRLVPSSELGLYAVAVNVTVLQTAVRSAVISAIFPRVSGGEPALIGRALRTTLSLTALVAIGLMVPVGIILPWLFGNNFSGAVDMARLLILAAVPQAGAEILASGLIGGGAPGWAARGQLVALAITIPGLLLLLHPLGGVGAALVSLVAYSVTFGFLLWKTIQRLGGRWSDYVVPRRSDVIALVSALASTGPRIRLWGSNAGSPSQPRGPDRPGPVA